MTTPNDNWTMFSTSKREIKELLVPMGEVAIDNDFLKIEKYLFEPSIAFRQNIFHSEQIDDIDFNSRPPTIRVKDELVFLSAEKKPELESFAQRNNIKTVKRPWIWEWILEPFLDTEITKATDYRLTLLLENVGLTADQVKSLRMEVKTQMLKYNFDTMLWDWCSLGACDVLKAMRTKYDKNEFADFYKRVMAIALLPVKISE